MYVLEKCMGVYSPPITTKGLTTLVLARRGHSAGSTAVFIPAGTDSYIILVYPAI